MGLAFFDYGTKNSDPIALDFALMHDLPEKELEAAKAHLLKISKGAQVVAKAQAEVALARFFIFETLNPIKEPVKSLTKLAEFQAAEGGAPLKNAFKRAEELQKRVDTGDSPEMAPPGKLQKIQGVSGKELCLHVQLQGKRANEKDPVVIFESGLGCFSPDWQFVQEALPQNIQSLSYDRAGMGWSQDDGGAPTIERTIAHLESLLKELNLKPPYLFVGHSYGGIVGQLFALKHPDWVQNLILVDSGLEDIQPTLGADSLGEKHAVDYLPPAAFHFIYDGRAHEVGDKMAIKVHDVTSRTSHRMTSERELQGYQESGKSLQRELAKTPQIKCPLQVITAGKFGEHELQLSKKWNEGQRNLLKRSAKSSQIIAENSDHMITHNQPEIITAAIQSCFMSTPK